MISENSIPPEYRQSVPQQLEMRLSGLRDAQAIVNEMWAYRRDQQLKQQEEQERERRFARERALHILRLAGISTPASFYETGRHAPKQEPGPPRAEDFDPLYRIPEMYKEWITPEIARRLSPADLWSLQQDEKNLETQDRGREWREQMREAGRIRQMPSYQVIPASVANGNPAVEHTTPPILLPPSSAILPLTPKP